MGRLLLTLVIFLALQCSGTLWVGEVSVQVEHAGKDERGGEGKREVEWEGKREERNGHGGGGVYVTLCHSLTHKASSPWRCPRG